MNNAVAVSRGKILSWSESIYANGSSMSNKQEEVEAIMKQAKYDLVAVIEMVGLLPKLEYWNGYL